MGPLPLKRAPTPRPRIMKFRLARVCAPQSSLGLRAHLPCGAPPGGFAGAARFPIVPGPAASRVFPFFPVCARVSWLDFLRRGAGA